jgi:FkbM family methyltransferase
MIDLTKFNWGPTSERFKKQVIDEIFNGVNDYEKLFEVEEDDIVIDIGSTVGEFTYRILDKKPKHCYVVEPVSVFFDTLIENLRGHPVSFTNAAITSDKYCKINWDGYDESVNTLTFNEFIKLNRLEHIDFLKFDCEGGEYDIFSEDNISFLKTIPKIVGEFHLRGILKEKFRYFRDKVLPNFNNYKFMSLDNIDITWDLKNEHFLEYYSEIYLYIDNR